MKKKLTMVVMLDDTTRPEEDQKAFRGRNNQEIAEFFRAALDEPDFQMVEVKVEDVK